MKQFVKNLFHEPLFQFLLIGAGLFLLFGWRGNPASVPGGQSGPPSTKIVVTRGDVDRLTANFTRTWMRPPTAEELKGLVDNLVREEIYYREALAIGLDRGDTIIRRRMRQKMEFIFEDITSQAEPTDEDLTSFMKKHPERYLVDPQVSFRQVFINVDKRRKNAEGDARRILLQLNEGMDPDSVGDAFLLEPETRPTPLWDIRKQYGEEFSNRLLELRQGRWEGPIRSGYGLHLVFVKNRTGGRLPELNEVRKMVKRDLAVERQKALKDAAYAKIRQRYTVEIEKPNTEPVRSIAQTGSKVVAQ